MNTFISVIIPNYNGSRTIDKCLAAVLASHYDRFEVIVVDDASTDNSVGLISAFPCRLIQFSQHAGASMARNTGAKEGAGEVIFFIDADCIVAENTLSLVHKAITGQKNVIIGGTYTPLPYDNDFFSVFQSIFIHYSELKLKEPDYIASHCMAVEKRIFEKSGGFPEQFLPIIEDVEFSHRLRRAGYTLRMDPDILVRHIFGYSFCKSLKNAFRKSYYWVMYSLDNSDLFRDSGTASWELKVNVLSYFIIIFFLLLYLFFSGSPFLFVSLLLFFFNLFINRKLLRAFSRAKGIFFAIPATLYYFMIYPLAVGSGSFSGMIHYYGDWCKRKKQG